MKQCWAEEPSERPSFNDITKALTIINDGKLAYYEYSFVLFFAAHFVDQCEQRIVK